MGIRWSGPVVLLLSLAVRGAGTFAEDDSPAGADPDAPVPDKVGAEVRLSKQERNALKKLECSMCNAIIHEMHVEVAKHGMTKGGVGAESQVWETSNAICLALLQKYRLDVTVPQLVKKPEDEEDDEAMMRSGTDPGQFMRSMLVLKMGCQRWVEDYGGDTSGYVFKSVREGTATAEGAANDYCSRYVNLCGSDKKERQRKKREQERERLKQRSEMLKKAETAEAKQKEADPFSSLPEDSKFGLQRMLELARDDPLHYLDEEAKERIRQARADLRCDVCRLVLEEAFYEVASRPRTMQREHDILPLLEASCEGGKDTSVPSYFGVEPPPLPPVWTDRYRPHRPKSSNRYTLRPFSKKAAKKRYKWRELANQGKQKPPSQSESEGDLMLTFACKDILEPERMTEALFKHMAACEKAPPSQCSAASAAARDVCRDGGGAPCQFGGDGGHASDDKEDL